MKLLYFYKFVNNELHEMSNESNWLIKKKKLAGFLFLASMRQLKVTVECIVPVAVINYPLAYVVIVELKGGEKGLVMMQ